MADSINTAMEQDSAAAAAAEADPIRHGTEALLTNPQVRIAAAG